MIQTESFSEFIEEIIKIYNEEQTENAVWDLFVHSGSEKTFQEFKDEVLKKPVEKPSKKNLEATIKQSFNTLDKFKPS